MQQINTSVHPTAYIFDLFYLSLFFSKPLPALGGRTCHIINIQSSKMETFVNALKDQHETMKIMKKKLLKNPMRNL